VRAWRLVGRFVVSFWLLVKATGGVDWRRQRDWRTLSLDDRWKDGRRDLMSPRWHMRRLSGRIGTIPKGRGILAEVDAPFLLDYRQHDILLIDDIAVVSPPPGFLSTAARKSLQDIFAGKR
jgi:hypothetical protein